MKNDSEKKTNNPTMIHKFYGSDEFVLLGEHSLKLGTVAFVLPAKGLLRFPL